MSFHFDHWEIDDATLLLGSTLASSYFHKSVVPQAPPLQRTVSHSSSGSSSRSSTKRKAIRYSETCAVVLIPSRKEYFSAGIDLWYHLPDLTKAQKEVSAEVSKILDFTPAMNIDLAMSYLYQPCPDHDDNYAYQAALNSNSSITSGCDFSDAKERLNLLIIDPHCSEELFWPIKRSLQRYNRWAMTIKRAESMDIAYEYLYTAARSKINPYDIVIIEESIFDCDEGQWENGNDDDEDEEEVEEEEGEENDQAMKKKTSFSRLNERTMSQQSSNGSNSTATSPQELLIRKMSLLQNLCDYLRHLYGTTVIIVFVMNSQAQAGAALDATAVVNPVVQCTADVQQETSSAATSNEESSSSSDNDDEAAATTNKNQTMKKQKQHQMMLSDVVYQQQKKDLAKVCGVDVIWQQPLQCAVHMLPVLLRHRQKQQDLLHLQQQQQAALLSTQHPQAAAAVSPSPNNNNNNNSNNNNNGRLFESASFGSPNQRRPSKGLPTTTRKSSSSPPASSPSGEETVVSEQRSSSSSQQRSLSHDMLLGDNQQLLR